MERSTTAKRAVRAEAHWAVNYSPSMGSRRLILIPFGALIDRWPVVLAVNLVWMVLLVASLYASRRHVSWRGAGARLGVAFLLFGLLYWVTCLLGFTRFPARCGGGLLAAWRVQRPCCSTRCGKRDDE